MILPPRLTVLLPALPALLLVLASCADGAVETAAEPSAPASSTESAPEPTDDPTPEPDETATSEPVEPEPTVDDPSQPVTTYEGAVARFDTFGQEPQGGIRFQTPDGIYCLLDSDFVQGCELNRGGIPAPEFCGDGPSQSVGRIERTTGAFEAVCNSDTIREPGAPKLAFDSVAAGASGLQCLSQSIGVTCIDTTTEQGFFLSGSKYSVF
ncbi:MAG: hypothetical protein WB767_08475 [Nocardioides sp.]